jgi:NADPH-dependent curcumin reductase CurA
VLSRMVNGGRVALCGLIANYTSESRPSDDYSIIIVKRLIVHGFLAFDYHDTQKAVHDLVSWATRGQIKAEETIEGGLENAPLVLNKLFEGSNRGKLLLRVADET